MTNKILAAPIFVVGYMHSGTTLLHNILAAHPTVFSATDETRYFGYLPLIKNLYPDLDDDVVLSDLIVMLADLIEHGNPARLRTAPKRYRPETQTLTRADLDTLLETARQDRTHGAAFRIVFDYLTLRAGKTRWLEKTPQHIFLIEDILDSIGNALFVEIVRDPRDILASKKKRKLAMRPTPHNNREEWQIRKLERVYDPFWESLEWRLAARAGRAAVQQHPDRVCSMRYEDLVMQPEDTIRTVCDFLDLPYSPDMLNVRWWNTAEGDRSQQTGIVSDAVGRWQRTLDSHEVGLCQWLCGQSFDQAGYARVAIPLSARLRFPWLVIRAGFGLVDRLIRRWRLGGSGFLANTLKNYWKELLKLLR
jgi:hypothetical protein